MKPAYILIDFENVQPDKIGALDAGAFKIKVFVGAKQSRVALGLASALQPMGNAVEYVQIEGSGRNALDLHIAYYIGRLSVEEPGAVFHIVSRDTDYDPLIDHLKGRKIHCHRWSSFGDIPHARAVPPKPAPAARLAAKPKPLPKAAAKAVPAAAAALSQVDEIVDNLVKRARARPSTLKALTSTIKSHFRGIGMTDGEADAIVAALERRGLIAVKDGKVSYRLA
jgi:PIN domain